MLYIDRILVPLDLTPGPQPALELALRVARRLEAEVCAVHVFPVRHRRQTLLADEYEACRDQVDHVLRTCTDGAAPTVACFADATRAATTALGLLDMAHRHHSDLLVVPAETTPGASGLADEVLRLSPCPVLTAAARPPRRWRRLLAPVDFSAGAQHALVHARALAARLDAELAVVHVIQTFHPTHPGRLRRAPAYYQRELRRFYAETPGPDVPATFHAVEGDAAPTLARVADELGADAIVMGTHGTTGFPNFLLGSVTRATARLADCPVLTIRTYGRAIGLASPSDFLARREPSPAAAPVRPVPHRRAAVEDRRSPVAVLPRPPEVRPS